MNQKWYSQIWEKNNKRNLLLMYEQTLWISSVIHAVKVKKRTMSKGALFKLRQSENHYRVDSRQS